MSTNIGIIGFGRIGAMHAEWLSTAEGCTAIAVCDPTAARRQLAVQRGLRAFESVEALLGETEVEAVVVATPTSMHFDHALASVTAGKHVMVEKPMTLDLAQALELVAASEQAGSVLSVFHNRRFDLDFLTVKSAIESGALGRAFNVESRLGQWKSCVGPAAPEWRPQWRTEASFGGGGLYDWGSHFLDQLWRLMHPAKPIRVFAQLRGNIWSRDCDDFARVVLDFDSGATGLVEINTTTTRPLPRWHIDGTLGSAFSPFSPDYDTEVWASLRFTPADAELPSRTLPRAAPSVDAIGIWEQFGQACRDAADPAVTCRSVLPTMALLDAARRSALEGRAIQLDDAIEWKL